MVNATGRTKDIHMPTDKAVLRSNISMKQNKLPFLCGEMQREWERDAEGYAGALALALPLQRVLTSSCLI